MICTCAGPPLHTGPGLSIDGGADKTGVSSTGASPSSTSSPAPSSTPPLQGTPVAATNAVTQAPQAQVSGRPHAGAGAVAGPLSPSTTSPASNVGMRQQQPATSAAPADVANKQDRMDVVFVSAEVAPWSKVGGLGDVVGALPRALASRGHRVMVVTPRWVFLIHTCLPR